MSTRVRRHLRTAGFSATLLLCDIAICRAQHLPLTTYTTTEGLPGNDVTSAVEDEHGFLWIGTEHGLARFDGKEFRTFGREQGLTDERVLSVVKGARDVLWIGTPSDVFRFEVRGGGVFTPVAVDGRRDRWLRTVLALDRDGRVWCGADGLYRMERAADQSPVLRRVPLPAGISLEYVNGLATDREGNVWAGWYHLYRRRPDGRFDRVENFVATGSGISFLSVDPRGRIWVTAPGGLWVTDGCHAVEASSDCRADRAMDAEVVPWTGPVWKPDGGFWVGASKALLETDRETHVIRRVSRVEGLDAGEPGAILFDSRGDLWIATGLTSLQRLASDGLTAFGQTDGLEAGLVNSIITTQAGELVVIGHPHVVHRLEHNRFSVTRPRMPPAVRDPGWGWYQVDLQDRLGQWWISTADGIVHWPAVRRPADLGRIPPELIAGRGCFRGLAVFRLYEDSLGDLWIATVEAGQPTLHRWRRATGAFECFDSRSFLVREGAPTAFLDDGNGALWIGFYEGQLVRYRAGRFTCLVDCANPSQGNITALTLDRRRRLWVATNRRGVLRLDDIAADHPTVVRFTKTEGLTSNRTRAVLEDRFGRLYIGTDLGIDVLDADGTPIRHYGVDDGLPHPFINMAQADAHGDLWFGTLNGLAWLKPSPPTTPIAPEVLIDGIRVAGVPRAVAASGEREIAGIVLAPDQRNLEVRFVTLPREASTTLRVQYRLSDAEPWSPAPANRSIVLAGLSPGDHRLQIRPLGGSVSATPLVATVSFRVLVPVYRRSWFLGLATLSVVVLIVAAYHSRMAHVTALERQRTRIAMDLHDEMGSRLGSIGLLADLAAEETVSGTPQRTRLEHIAETAADMGSSLGDIVWSLRGGAVAIEAVAQHLVVHGRRLFPGPWPAFQTDAPEPWPSIDLSPAAGRAVLLIGLEALHNCARHAKASEVTLTIRPRGRGWVLSVSDDGCGIPAATLAASGSESGFGMHTMHRRAEEIGGTLEIESWPDRGTVVQLTFSPRAAERGGHRMNIRGRWARMRGTTVGCRSSSP